MFHTILRVLLIAAAVHWALPYLFNGIQFHGNLAAALGIGLAFSASYLAAGIALRFSLTRIFGALDKARKLVPLWVSLYWVLSAALLMLVSAALPEILTVSGWAQAAGGGLVLLAIGTATASSCSKSPSSHCGSDRRAP